MNLTENKRLFQLLTIAIVLIIFVILAMVIFSLFGRRKPVTSPPKASIAPNIVIPPQTKPEDLQPDVIEIRKKIIASQIDNRGGDILLFQADSFVIEYIPAPDVFFVTIDKDPASEAKQQAQKWFLDFGLQQNDLCDLPVRFILDNFEIRKTNPTFTSLPDGCTGEPLKKP